MTMDRLLSPTHRRIWTPAADDDKTVRTSTALTSAGWAAYAGPALVDAHGFVVVGSDPDVMPTTVTHVAR